MTRQEFIRNITTWRELLDFCYVYDCECCDEIITRQDLGGSINSDLIDYQGEYNWTTVRDLLFLITDAANYYSHSGFLNYTPVDDSFEYYKADVLAWCDEDASVFDDEDEDDEELDEEEPDLTGSDLSDDYLLEVLEEKFY